MARGGARPNSGPKRPGTSRWARRRQAAKQELGEDHYRRRTAELLAQVDQEAMQRERNDIAVVARGKVMKLPTDPHTRMATAMPANMVELIERLAADNRKTRFHNPNMNPFQIHWQEFPPMCRPPKDVQMAMDENLAWAGAQWAGGGPLGLVFAEGLAFPGYPYLSELAQRPEYRTFSEIIGGEMTRKWIKFRGVGTGKKGSAKEKDSIGKKTKQKSERIKELTDFFSRLNVRGHYKAWQEIDGLFGRGHLFHEFGENDGSTPKGLAELKTPIGNGSDDRSKSKVGKKNPLTALRTVEPVWTYPTTYNATNPLARDWYNPQVWYTMGQQIDVSRLFLLIGRPVPDMLKPAYSFGGLSLSQMAKPYVDIWLNTRESVSRTVQGFSTMVLAMDMQSMLQPGATPGGAVDVIRRVNGFNSFRDNNQTWVVNKDTEEVTNVAVPLSGLDLLQAQAQEHMCAVNRIPVAIYTGITPQGLNASSEGEIRIFENTIHSYQEDRWRHPLMRTMHFAMLSLWDEVDEEITFDFVPLREMTEKEEAEINKLRAETGDLLINGSMALHPEEERLRVATDDDSGYHDLDPDDVPEPPDPMEMLGGGAEPGGKLNLSGHIAGGGSASAKNKTGAVNLAGAKPQPKPGAKPAAGKPKPKTK